MSKSPVDGQRFGVADPETNTIWEGRFIHRPGTLYPWGFEYLDPNDDGIPELTAYAGTPKEAWQEVITRFISLNGNQVSPTLAKFIPMMESCFNADGGVKAEYILGGI